MQQIGFNNNKDILRDSAIIKEWYANKNPLKTQLRIKIKKNKSKGVVDKVYNLLQVIQFRNMTNLIDLPHSSALTFERV